MPLQVAYQVLLRVLLLRMLLQVAYQVLLRVLLRVVRLRV
jgi:hypothetical protein